MKKKLGFINMYPTHEGKEYPMTMNFYDDGSVELTASKDTPPHLLQEASRYVVESMRELEAEHRLIEKA